MNGKKLLTTPMALKQLQSLPPSLRQSILRAHHLRDAPLLPIPSTLIPRTLSRSSSSSSSPSTSPNADPGRIIRPLVPPPREGSGPLLSRRPDRALPDLPAGISVWLKTLPIFVLLITVSSLAIFNYEKSTSSTVNSILYALRTNIHARDLLGDEIYFASKLPWISGELSPMQGVINIRFRVKGTKGVAETKFVAVKRRGGFFETLEWSLRGDDGTEVQLLEKEGTTDPLEGQRLD
ncbi:Cytochrome c oxidase assembly protein 1 [Cladophialophora carrionii]|uniref:Cytochrome c oxidase assembly protein 1 n=1 Tax=Cladophialophora carrionii TaxID=86049 RepID=A0A1C1CT03_9EURO|nr:Cytochrome c oxidase assembly protein 1 [Cladophialophora carrionii]